MGSGLSMTSVNKIKELAEAREYSLAVEILDSQNLEASFNPQFLRVCGEVYENVGRFKDARNMYVKAHAMGPESSRIIFSLIQFYLKLGYRKLAELYKEQYIFSVKGAESEVRKLSYILDKAKRAPLPELREYLDPWYIHDMDEIWSFELFLINQMEGKDNEMLASDYRATFKRSRYSEQLQEVLDGRISAEKLFYIYPEEEKEDKDPEEDEIRKFELEQLKKDYDRLHPEEAKVLENEEGHEEDGEAEIIETPDTETKIKSFLKRKFRKKVNYEEDASEEEQETDTEGEDNTELTGKTETADDAVPDTQEEEETQPEGTKDQGEQDTAGEPADDTEPEEQTAKKSLSWVRNLANSISERGRNKEEMQELTIDEDALLSVDFDDGFAAETDTIAELAPDPEEKYENPFDIINAYRLAENDSRSFSISFETMKNEVVEEKKEAYEEPIVSEVEPEEEEPETEEPELEEEPETEEPELEEEPEIEEPELEEEPETEEPELEEEPEAEETEFEEEPETEEPEFEEEPEAEEEESETEEPELEEEEPETEEPELEEKPEAEETEFEEEPETEEPELEEEPEAEEEESEAEAEEPETEMAAEAENAESEFYRKVRETNEKLDEGLLEEERLQKEAETLLASLGIKL